MTTRTNAILSRFSGSTLTGVAFKDHNRKKNIILHLSQAEEATINEIAELLNISIPKATELVASLEQEGLLKSSGKRSEGPGRKASYFTLAAESFFFLGLEIKKYKINIGLMGFDRNLIAQKEDIPFFYQDAEESLKEILRIIKQFLKECGVHQDKIFGLGCSISGRVNRHSGEILTIYHFGDAPVKKVLEDELGIPVFLDNDSRCLSYGEFHFGLRNKEKEVLILNLDYGLAVGIFVNGLPIYGVSGYAGELGHIPMFDNEKICFCGKKGCLETEASGKALIDYLVAEMGKGSNSLLQPVLQEKGLLELEDVVDAIRRGDNLALLAISDVGEKLGRGLSVTINLFNPELIVIGGNLSAVGEPLLLPIKTAILQHSLPIVSNDTRVVLSKIHEKAGLLGTCLLVRDKVLGLV